MFRKRFAVAWVVAAAALTAPACAVAQEPDANPEITERLVRGDFTVAHRPTVPVAAAERVADRVEAARAMISAYLAQSPEYAGPPYDTPLEIVIDPERFGPFQSRSSIYLPEARVLNAHDGVEDARTDLGIVHEMTHVLAASFNRENRDRFYDDGLAVFLQHRFGWEPNYPDFGLDLYLAVARAAAEHGGLVPLADAEEVRGASETRIGRKLAYLEEGAFTQFLIERYGLDAYFRVYQGAAPAEVTGRTLDELEADFFALVRATAGRAGVELAEAAD